MRRAALLRALARVPPPDSPRAEWEQVVTPPELAADLLFEALAREDIAGRSVVDLGAGTGRLAIGAALLGAQSVRGVEVDPALGATARTAAARAGVAVEFEVADVRSWTARVDTVVMNPPFGAQRRHADRPFWECALSGACRAIYAFALRDARPFVEARIADAEASVESVTPVRWRLERTFPHHAHDARAIAVDLWAVRASPDARRFTAGSVTHARGSPRPRRDAKR
jgi:putative methylase